MTCMYVLQKLFFSWRRENPRMRWISFKPIDGPADWWIPYLVFFLRPGDPWRPTFQSLFAKRPFEKKEGNFPRNCDSNRPEWSSDVAPARGFPALGKTRTTSFIFACRNFPRHPSRPGNRNPPFSFNFLPYLFALHHPSFSKGIQSVCLVDWTPPGCEIRRKSAYYDAIAVSARFTRLLKEKIHKYSYIHR